jgi:hypothetical protein
MTGCHDARSVHVGQFPAISATSSIVATQSPHQLRRID